MRTIDEKYGKFTARLRAKVGGLSKKDLVSKLDNVRMVDVPFTLMLNEWSKDIMTRPDFVVSEIGEYIDFGITTPRKLGFKEAPITPVLFDKTTLALQGLRLCKPDDGPSVRIAHTRQPDNERVSIGMKPICDIEGNWLVYGLERYGSELWLMGHHDAYPLHSWSLDGGILFRLNSRIF